MKKLIIILLISQTVVLFGQEFKTKKKKVDMRNGTATYFVLANNDTIKQGEYQIKAYTGNRILLKGTYNNNKKVGLWLEQYYGKDYKGPMATGNYNNDVKTGDWIYFNYKGDTVQIYNWTENKIVMAKICGTDTKEYTVLEDGKEYKSKLDCPPYCVSGQDYFMYGFIQDIGDNSEHFKKVGNELYQLKTKIYVTIDKNSSITEISYSTDEKKELKEFIEKYIKSYNWVAGKKDGKFITSKFEFSINFSSQY